MTPTRRRRPTPLTRLLARLGWQRDRELWTVRCRDERGHRASLRIGLTRAEITISPTTPGPWQLTALESGRLRGAVRDALLTLDQLPDSTTATRERPGGQGSSPDLAPPTGCPAQRQRPDPPRPRATRKADAAAPEVLPTAA